MKPTAESLEISQEFLSLTTANLSCCFYDENATVHLAKLQKSICGATTTFF